MLENPELNARFSRIFFQGFPAIGCDVSGTSGNYFETHARRKGCLLKTRPIILYLAFLLIIFAAVPSHVSGDTSGSEYSYSFVHLSDVQTLTTAYPSTLNLAFTELEGLKSQYNISALFITGDLTNEYDGGPGDGTDFARYAHAVTLTTIPVYEIAGNHDVADIGNYAAWDMYVPSGSTKHNYGLDLNDFKVYGFGWNGEDAGLNPSAKSAMQAFISNDATKTPLILIHGYYGWSQPGARTPGANEILDSLPRGSIVMCGHSHAGAGSNGIIRQINYNGITVIEDFLNYQDWGDFSGGRLYTITSDGASITDIKVSDLYLYPELAVRNTVSYNLSSGELPSDTGSITVTSPDGGESWAAGSTQRITWTASGDVGSYVKIELLKGGVVLQTVSSGTDNDGSFSGWTIPTGLVTGSDYQVRISSTTSPSISGTSAAYFTITSSTSAGSIAVTSTPSGARIFLDGSDTSRVTPYTLTGIAVGSHTVYVTMNGYVTPSAVMVTVASGQTEAAAFTLVQGTGSITVTSTPAGAKIFLDGTDTSHVTPYTLTSVPVGDHSMYVTLNGYITPTTQTKAVTRDSVTTFDFPLTATSSQPATKFVARTSGTSDGLVQRSSGTGESFSSLRNGAGTGADPTTGYLYFGISSANNNNVNLYGLLQRAEFLFDTSGLPDNAIIINATVSIWSGTSSSSLSQLGSTSYGITGVNPGTPGVVGQNDYQNVINTRYSDNDIPQASVANYNYNIWIFNANGLSSVSKTGWTNVAVRTKWDIDNDITGLTWASSAKTTQILLYAAEGHTGKEPTLTIYYMLPSGNTIQPVANFVATPLTGTSPLTVTFTDLSTNTPTSWNWSFGDSSTVNSTMQNPVHGYANAGTYTVSLNATNSAGSNSKTQTGYITVTSGGAAPVTNFVATPLTGTSPLTVTFTDLSTNTPTSWNWSFGDGSTVNSTMQNPVHRYANAGTYTVSLNATNSAGSNSKTQTGYITVTSGDAAPVTNFVATPLTGTSPLTVTFTDLSTNTPTSWNWSFGDGSTVNSTMQNPVHRYANAGTYTISLNTTNSAGSNSKTQTGYITVTSGDAAPIANFVATPLTGTSPLTVTFTDQSTNIPTSWKWEYRKGSGSWTQFSTVQSPSYTFPATGTYSIRLTATNSAGSNTLTKTSCITVTAPLKPVAAFSATPRSGNVPLTVRFTDQSTNTPTSWKWEYRKGSGSWTQFSTVQSPSYTFPATGTYGIRLTATNSAGSTVKTQTGYITVTSGGAAPAANFVATPLSGTPPLTVTFTDLSTNTPASWNWSFGDGSTVNSTMQNPVHRYANAGTYTVSLNATNSAGSTVKTQTEYITVTSGGAAPAANFVATPLTGTSPLTVTFTDLSTNAPASWNWSFGDGSTVNSTMQNPVHRYADSGTYTVSLNATNSAGSTVKTRTGYITVTSSSQPATKFVARTSGTSDGLVQRSSGTGESFSSLRNGAGTGADPTTGYLYFGISSANNNNANLYGLFQRAEFLFDTSGLPDNAIIINATVSIWSGTSSSSLSQLGSTSYGITGVNPGTPGVVGQNDYQNVINTRYSDNDIPQASVANYNYNIWIFNANGLSSVSKTGWTNVAVRTKWDIDNDITGLTWASSAKTTQILLYAAEGHTGKEPTLTLFYTVP
ncbi:MAG: PKD domain-containing protein [Methanoregula sp.]